MSYLIVLPSIVPEWTEHCLGSLHPSVRDNVMVVDNSVTNRGVPASWNLGIIEARRRGVDFTCFLSASMRFGAPGGRDFFNSLEHPRVSKLHVGVFAEKVTSTIVENHAWHLVALRLNVVNAVGLFDENFSPAYFEDQDYAYRISLLFPAEYAVIPCDCFCYGNGHGVTLGGARNDPSSQLDYFVRKWGGVSSQQTFKYPFNNPEFGIQYWPEPGPWPAQVNPSL